MEFLRLVLNHNCRPHVGAVRRSRYFVGDFVPKQWKNWDWLAWLTITILKVWLHIWKCSLKLLSDTVLVERNTYQMNDLVQGSQTLQTLLTVRVRTCSSACTQTSTPWYKAQIRNLQTLLTKSGIKRSGAFIVSTDLSVDEVCYPWLSPHYDPHQLSVWSRLCQLVHISCFHLRCPFMGTACDCATL